MDDLPFRLFGFADPSRFADSPAGLDPFRSASRAAAALARSLSAQTGRVSEEIAANSMLGWLSGAACCAGASDRNTNFAGPTCIMSPSANTLSATGEPLTRTPSSNPAVMR